MREALDRFGGEVCLIEADRDREKVRLTYSDFKEIAMPLTRALEDAGFDPGERAAIVMTNQSKWLISAYAVFYSGGVLVPLDYKLTADEQLLLLAHSKAKVLIIEYHLWRAITKSAVSEYSNENCFGDRSACRRGSFWRISLGGFQAQGGPRFCDAAKG